MNRFNYHQTAYERFTAGVSIVALAKHIRLPAVMIGAALLTVAGSWTFDTHRIATLGGELAALQARLQAATIDDAHADRLTAAVTRLRAVRERIAAARHDVLATTNTIALIGNGLPPQTWLTVVGSTPAGDWTIGGRSTRVDEIGTMLRRIQELNRNAAARLVSVAATGRTGRVLDFVIGWDVRS